ncbi:tRNA dihydrouridine synthase [Deferribacter abyssi]|uniref:tRNA dihydrouridine synthase n=1 Tax=Deferribacter abyssi TaxID=213806 RepID=UPI003C1DDC9B
MVAAPLAGITTLPFRRILRKFFDGIIFTEMVSVEGIKRKVKKTLNYIEITENDHPVFLQLFGYEPTSFYNAIKVCEEVSNPDGYDLNAGCPVKKVLKSYAGSYLLKDLKQLREIVKNMRKATDKPISVKTRLGWDEKSYVYKEILKICEGEGVDILTFHARTKSQMFSGETNLMALNEIVNLKKNILLIGNGNIYDRISFYKMLDTGVDAVMIGRAMMKAPWIFSAIKKDKDVYNFLSLEDKKQLIIELLQYEKAFRKNYLDIVRKYSIWFLKGYKNSSDFRKKIYQIKTENEFLKLLEGFVE